MDTDLIAASVRASSPEIIVIIGACAALMLSLWPHQDQQKYLTWLSLITILLASAQTLQLSPRPVNIVETTYSGMFVVDAFATYFKMLLYLGTALTILMSGKFLQTEEAVKGEYYVLLLFALAGTMIMVSGADLLIIYIGLELQALSIYVLTGFLKTRGRSVEAALKYVILGAFSSGILLYGLSLIYGLTGSTQLGVLNSALATADLSEPMLILATVFLLVGLLFKIGAVPFHMWVPDIYEGAPTPITAYLSVASKTAAFAVLLRVFMGSLIGLEPLWSSGLAAIAVATMALGSLVALVQDNIKRLLAYSSISHVGFLLLGIIAGTTSGMSAILLYLLIYTFMTLGLFAIVILLHRDVRAGEPLTLFSGLAQSHAGLAFMAMIFLFSLAGIPPTGGFFAKFYVLVALIDAGHVTLAVIAVLLSAVAAWFYLRLIMLIYIQPAEPTTGSTAAPATGPTGHARAAILLSAPMRLVLLFSFSGTVLSGIFPAWFLAMARQASLSGLGN
ncbi:NADH-quinone oxidoreductase subunit N [Candidatus Halocynthiibacter alkanivorans]|uniref:NADH-quinone oxidoreductase subunit N n=1 Tax=Candidatus Halocynthiibacter alkanivorans TaxID=2267619 RepID=UPI000DF36BD3|nr:NADH-quinone oxidoreductase subunit N [Candidatus Halocynthiibacter alkanivorans]